MIVLRVIAALHYRNPALVADGRVGGNVRDDSEGENGFRIRADTSGHMFEQSFGRALAAVTLIGALASTGAVEPTEPQESPARRYSQGGLEFDLPGDWHLTQAGAIDAR